VRPLVRVSVTVIMQERGAASRAPAAAAAASTTLAYFTDDVLRDYAKQAVHQARVNLAARPAPAGEMTVVLGSGWPGILLHEAIGHGLEGDFNRKGSSAFAGRIGERVAAQASRWSTTARYPTGAARFPSTTRAIRRSAPC
jgi:TldD protein